jgi:PAS domain S-box-containing protein
MPENLKDNETHYNIISGLITTLNRISLYPANHPVIKSALQETHARLQDFLALKKELTFSLSAENRILIEGSPVVIKAKGLLEEFISQFKRLQAESITFSQGLAIEELEVFLKTLLMKPEDLNHKGGINQIITEDNIKHIKVNLFSYIKVEKDKEVIAVEKGRINPLELGTKVKEFLQGKSDEAQGQGIKNELYRQFLENPQGLIDLTKNIIANAQQIIRILDTVGESLVKDTKSKDVKAKIEQAKAITRFSLQLKKLTGQLTGQFKEKEEMESIKSAIEEHTTGFTNEILVDVVATEYTQKKSWTSTLKGYIKRLFLGAKDKAKIQAALKNNLQQSGISQQDIDNFSAQVEEVIEESKAKITKGDREELGHLKDENETLKSTVDSLKSELREFEELKRAHKLVLSEKERIEKIIHHMAEGLVVVDSSGQIMLMNPAAERLLNVNKQEVQGKPLREKIKDEHLLTFTKNLVPDKDGSLTKEIELLSPDESTKRVLRTSSAVVENQEGQTVGMVMVLNDITRQREIEKLKSDFVANVSHELRTPLVVIQQSLSILTNEITDKLNEDQKRFLSNSQNNLERLRNLISDLLDMASIEAGKFKLKLGLFDINEVASGTVTFLDKWAKGKGIILEAQLLPSKTEMQIDKDRVIQAITNLVGNAIKFTPNGGKITLALSERAADDYFKYPAIQVSVEDSGCGIEAKDLERIFNKFERVSSGQLAEVPGTGLGLTITKEIVEAHKGKIWVESEAGKGSTFTFLLPRNLEEVK